MSHRGSAEGQTGKWREGFGGIRTHSPPDPSLFVQFPYQSLHFLRNSELLQNFILMGLCCSRPPHLAELLAYTLLGVSSIQSRGPSSSPKRWQVTTIREGASLRGFPHSSVGENPPAMQETRVWFLDQEDPLEKGITTHSGIFAWRIPRTKEPSRLYSPWVRKSQTWLRDSTTTLKRRWIHIKKYIWSSVSSL